MQFFYQAVDARGKKQRGQVEAACPRSARLKLREKQLIVLSMAPVNKFSLLQGQPTAHIKDRDLVLLTRQLATLVEAALPLEEALRTLAQQCEKPAHASMIRHIRDRVAEGIPFAEALGVFPRTFSSLFRAMIAAGEASGHLSPVLTRLADQLEQNQQIKSKLLHATVYPLVLTLVAIGVVSILLSVVVPKVVAQFIHMQQTLPLTTQLLMGISDGVRHYGPWLLLIGILTGLTACQLLRRPATLLRWHQQWLRLPIVGRVSLALNTARYARTLSILHASAVPLLEAMRISAAVLTNSYVRQQLLLAEERVREGGLLSQALEQTGLLSPMMRHMIASGESSGQLEKMLAHAANIQDKAFTSQITIALALFEPLLVIGMASMVLFIILAILQPILQLNSMIG